LKRNPIDAKEGISEEMKEYPHPRFHLAFRDMGGVSEGHYCPGADPRVEIHITRIWKRVKRERHYDWSGILKVKELWMEWLHTETHEWLHGFMHLWKTGYWSSEKAVVHGTDMIMNHLRDFWKSTSQTPFDPFDFYDYEQEDNIFLAYP